ncbi:YfiR family protein [Vibrio aquaticus]|uniref:YfiR family protein n=1 Tax=Vibrio aquaticus TaxID=2496559 RepID=A0A3S0N717_9VIBR|nr:YfiR family protein [Vibrio aquaticus]RTZ17378.1 YfiR family protein [Vibrio aquaticus]
MHINISRVSKITSLLWLLTLSPMTAHAKYTPDQVKAVYLYRIATFVQWENEAQMDSINICVQDNEKVNTILSKLTQDKLIRNKPLKVVSSDCDVLYISQEQNLNRIESVPTNTVTIGGMESFTENGGAIELVEHKGKIRPKVNLDNIKGYQLSSNFLRVAEVVGGQQ